MRRAMVAYVEAATNDNGQNHRRKKRVVKLTGRAK